MKTTFIIYRFVDGFGKTQTLTFPYTFTKENNYQFVVSPQTLMGCIDLFKSQGADITYGEK
jgi:hypothetical protein